MAKLNYGIAPTSVILRVKLLDSSVTTGAGLTGLTYSSSGLIISTIRIEEAAPTVYTSAGSTIETIATLGTYAAPTATKCRFKEVDATNHPGLYELQFANARFASENLSSSLIVSISGASNLAQCDVEVQLSPLDSNLKLILGTDVSAPATAGILDINVKNIANAVVNTSTAQIGANVVSQANIDFGALQKTSLNAATPASVQNIAAQTGDSFVRLGVPMEESISNDIYNCDSRVLFVLDQIGINGSSLTALGDTRLANLDATISSRLAPAGTLATVTNLTNAPTAGDFTTAMKTSLNAATPASVQNIPATGTGLTAIPWNAAWDAEVQSEVADALTAYDPPTRAEATSDKDAIVAYVDKIDDATDGLTAIKAEVEGLAGAAMRGTDNAALASVCTEVRLAELDAANLITDVANVKTDTGAILTDTADMQPKLGTPAGVSISADIAAIEAQTDDIGAAGAGLTALGDARIADIAAIKAKTDNLPSGIEKNVALSNFQIYMVLSADHITAATGKTLTGTISKDGGAFAALTNAISEIGNGLYKVNVTQTEMNADVITLKFTETNCDQRMITLYTT